MADNTQQSSTRYKLMTTFTPMSTLPERLQKILSEMEGPDHGKQSRLAKIAGSERAAISHYLKNPGAEIGYEYAKNIADALNYNVDWIISGRQPERIEVVDKTITKILQYVDENEAALLTHYREATVRGKKYILESGEFADKLSTATLSSTDKPK